MKGTVPDRRNNPLSVLIYNGDVFLACRHCRSINESDYIAANDSSCAIALRTSSLSYIRVKSSFMELASRSIMVDWPFFVILIC